MRTTAFMQRSYSIYRHQTQRAKEHALHLDYTLEDLRQAIEGQQDIGCEYCGCELKDRLFSCDHDQPIARGGTFEMKNVCVCCMNCNQAKGPLTGDEFLSILESLKRLNDFAKRDVIKRLRAGGRFIYRR